MGCSSCLDKPVVHETANQLVLGSPAVCGMPHKHLFPSASAAYAQNCRKIKLRKSLASLLLSHNIPDCLLKTSCDGHNFKIIYSSSSVFLVWRSLLKVQPALRSPQVNNFLSSLVQLWTIGHSIPFWSVLRCLKTEDSEKTSVFS